MAVTRTNYGTIDNETAGTTVALTVTGGPIPAGTFLVLVVTADNVTATTPTVSSVSALGSDTWTARAGANSQQGASATAGSGVFVYCYTMVTTASVANGTVITITFNASPVAKTGLLVGLTEVSNTLRSTVVSAGASAGAPSAVTAGTALVAGDIVIGVAGCENSGAWATDTDTLNGSWVLGNNAFNSGGSAVTNTSTTMQYKVVTATGAQTFNPGGGANDALAIVFAMQPPPPVAPAARTISAAAGSPPQTAVSLTWADDAAAFPDPTYLIERSPDGSTGWTTVASGQTGQTGYNATGLTPGTTYYFRVTGSNASGSSTSNTAGPITTTSYPKISTASETFDTLTAWTTIAGTPTINAGQLQLDMVVPPGEAIQSNAVYDMTESSVFFKYTAPALTVTAGRDFYLQVRLDASNYVAAYLRRAATAASSYVTGYYNDAGSQGQFDTSLQFNAGTMVYVRLRNSGQVFYVDYSADGNTWTNAVSRDFGNLTLANKLKTATIYMLAQQSATDATDPQFSLIDSINIVAAAGGRPKVYLGSFTAKPLKVYSGSAWNTKPVKVWTGSTWKTLT